MKSRTDRRRFLTNTGVYAALLERSLALGASPSMTRPAPETYGLMQEVARFRKMDAHAHVGFEPGDEDTQLDMADRLGINRLCISKPITNFSGTEPEGPEQVKEANDLVLKAVRKHPDRYIGYLTLNPAYPKEAMEELDRCLDQGMAGYKGYTQVKINHPLYYPIIEKLIDRKMIILMHASCQLGLAGYRMKYDIAKAPNTSIPDDFVEVAQRYPEAIFQYAHIGGGGDWEYACKAFRNVPNIYVDTSGSNNAESMIDFALQCLGEDRLLYGSDGSFYQGIGKLLAASLTEQQRQKIFFGNLNSLLAKSGHHVD